MPFNSSILKYSVHTELARRDNQPVRSAYQPPASSTFLSEQTSHQQSASGTLLSEQTSTSHQPPANRTGSTLTHNLHMSKV
jgi:hypothetical protein